MIPRDHEVHIWLAGEPLAGQSDARLEQLLDDTDRARLAQFGRAAPRRDHLVGRALVRTALSALTGVPATSWRLAREAHGKPVVDEPRPHAPSGERPLHFNLTHTRGLVACAMSTSGELGIDAEHIERRKPTDKLAARFFAREEVEAMRTLPVDEQTNRFFQLWTLKESFLKATGKGLSAPLSSCIFRWGPTGLLRFGHLEEDSTRWLFLSLAPSPTHQLALCLRSSGVTPSVRFHVLHDVDRAEELAPETLLGSAHRSW